MNRSTLFLSLLAGTALAADAQAQRLLIPDSTNNVLMEFDGMDGSLVNPLFSDLEVLTFNAIQQPTEALIAPNGELWVADQFANVIFRISADGSMELGNSNGGYSNIRGMAVSGDGVLIANANAFNGAPGPSVIQTDGLAEAGAAFTSSLFSSPYDVEPFVFNGVEGYLVSEFNNDDLIFVEAANPANQQVFHDSGGFGTGGITIPCQVHVSESGRVFAAGLITPSGIFEYDPATGAQINFFDTETLGFGDVFGVYQLGNGNFIFTNLDGIHVYDVAANSVSTVVTGIAGRFVSNIDVSGPIGSSFCTVNPNSTGALGELAAAGLNIVANNDVTLTASQLPADTFGFFITSLDQGFVMNPGGSSGNLCLSGSIGRYVGPGQILNSGPGQTFSLQLDLTQVPQPTGPVAVSAGQTWNFQTWFRDTTVSGAATSNFTNGLEITFQ